jgi:hypothetical protein
MKRYSIVLASILIAACGGCSPDLSGIDIGGGAIDFPDEAVGGAWVGTEPGGNQILALVTESGRLNWISVDTGEQGFGTVSVQAWATTIEYTLVAPWGFTLADSSTSATCGGGGTISERDHWATPVNCTTSLGGSIESFTDFRYDALYDRDSSLALIAGDYDDSGLVISISATGEIFEQDPASGCVVNGQVSIIDSQFNVYDVSITYSNCTGDEAVLNGAIFTGLGILDDTVVPETAIFGVTGAVGNETYSLVSALPRL